MLPVHIHPQRAGKLLRRQPGQIDVYEIRIAEVLRARVERDAHRLCQKVNRGCIAPVHGSEVIAFQDIQHLNHRRPAGTRRRHAYDFISTIRAADRRTDLGLVPGEVLQRDKSAMRAKVVNQLFRDLTAIKSPRPLIVDQLQCMREVSLSQRLAGFVVGASRLAKHTPEFGETIHRCRFIPQRSREDFVNLQKAFNENLSKVATLRAVRNADTKRWTTTDLNLDLLLRLPSAKGIAIYGGGAPTVTITSGGDSDLGATWVFGAQIPVIKNRATNLEMRFGAGGMPKFRLLAVFVF